MDTVRVASTGPAVAVAWCPVNNLLAIATERDDARPRGVGSSSGTAAPGPGSSANRSVHEVILLEPSQPRECYHLHVPVAGQCVHAVARTMPPLHAHVHAHV